MTLTPATTPARRPVLRWVSRPTGARLELLLILALGVEFQAEAWLAVPGDGGRHLQLAVLCLLQTAGLLLSRRHPLAAMGPVLLPQLAFAVMPATVIDHLSLVALAPVLASLSLGARADGRRLRAGVAFGVVAEIVTTLLDHYADSSGRLILVPLLVVGGPVFVGRAIRDRQALNAALRDRAEQAEAARDARAHEAVLLERARMADELHDVIAHSLSGMIVQASGARRLLATEPERARSAFERVEHTGREALGDIRRMLGVLRREDEGLALAPQPGLAQLDALVARSRSAGLHVAYTLGDPGARRLSAGSDVIAYRVVEEALAVARGPGGAGSVTVTIRPAADHLVLEIDDDGDGEVGPERLFALRERVAVYGGELHTGTGPDGRGHVLRARLPVGVVG